MKPIEIVQIDKLIPLYKNGEPANSIEVVHIRTLDGESVEFNIVAGKGLYHIDEKVIYIQPDYCLPDDSTFDEYFRPDGDPQKSKLGKKGRIRAVKFNLNFKDSIDPIYSNGIILPYVAVDKEFDETTDLEQLLNITKYVAEDSFEKQSGGGSGMQQGEMPSFLYKTDEPRAEMLKGHINKIYDENYILSGSIKRDGSSITIYCQKDHITGDWITGICSRQYEKKLDQSSRTGWKAPDGSILRPHFDRETKIKGWFDDTNNTFYTTEMCQDLGCEEIRTPVKDAWVDTVKKFDYLNKLEEYCILNDVQLAMRGELIGQGNKGSGNKLNQDARLPESQVVWFGVDNISSWQAERINASQNHNLEVVCGKLGFNWTEEVVCGIFDYDTMISTSNHYFEKIKEKTGQIIEGLVFRTKYNNGLSVKYINPDYDSRS